MEEKYIQYIKGFKYLDKDLTDEVCDSIVEEINDIFDEIYECFEDIIQFGVYSSEEDCEDIGFEFVIENNRITGFATDLDFLS